MSVYVWACLGLSVHFWTSVQMPKYTLRNVLKYYSEDILNKIYLEIEMEPQNRALNLDIHYSRYRHVDVCLDKRLDKSLDIQFAFKNILRYFCKAHSKKCF